MKFQDLNGWRCGASPGCLVTCTCCSDRTCEIMLNNEYAATELFN